MKGVKRNAGALIVLALTTLSGLSPEAKAAPGDRTGRGIAPSFLFFSPHRALEETSVTLADVDFRNRTYRFSGGRIGGPPKEFLLNDGKYPTPGPGAGVDEVVLSEVRHLPSGATPPELAVVFLSRTYGGGSSNCDGLVQVFAIGEGRLLLQHEISYDCHGESGARISESGDELEIRSVAYAPEDAHCCPSFQDVATFKVHAAELTLSRWERRPYPSSDK